MKRFQQLRGYLAKYDMDQSDVQEMTGKSPTYVSNRMTGKMPWSQDDQYILMDELDIPYEDMYLVFPKKGMPVDIRRRITIDPKDMMREFAAELSRAVG